MACGTPVVVSDIEALREVTDKAGIFVDPYKALDIAKGIAKVLSMNKTDYESLVEKGLSQAEKFSWEDTARKTIKILEKSSSS